MNRGLENGYIGGISSGIPSGLSGGLHSGNVMQGMTNRVNPASEIAPKTKPVFLINGENITLISGLVQYATNVMPSTSGELFPKYENIFEQLVGSTYRPTLARGGFGGRNYINFADTVAKPSTWQNSYLASAVSTAAPLYYQSAPSVSGAGITLMMVVRRAPGISGAVTLFDGREAPATPSPNDLLLELDASNRITFDYRGGQSGTTTAYIGTAGRNLLKDWSIVTVKCQLRIDGGALPSDTTIVPGPGIFTKKYAHPSGADISSSGVGAPLEVFVNGIQQPLSVTTNTYTNGDYFGDSSFRMVNRRMYIGNKGTVYGTAGTHIAAVLMVPCFLDKAIQQRWENHFRSYYSYPF